MSKARITSLAILLLYAVAAHADTKVPELKIERSANRLLIQGDVSSTAHEVILRETVNQEFATIDAQFDLQPLTPTPPGWALITELTLRAMAQTQHSTATIAADRLTIRGITLEGSDWSRAIDRVDAFLLPGMRLEHTVAVLSAGGSQKSLCHRQFAGAVSGVNYQFSSDSAALPVAMLGMLDALVEVVTDCPEARLDISGHTDNLGLETANVALSLARAEAVAAYLTARGVNPERLSVRGMGSAEPVTDNSTPTARRRNRRIEFALTYDE